ncbi:MAG: cytochrome d ubiquinol oxidase subunit II [Clostridia bacterium]|nr:cytochrome d ubiquinol oxidase subunit II [Clostridia bacterium]
MHPETASRALAAAGPAAPEPVRAAALLLAAVLALYALLGLADFGAGLWDLAAARGPRAAAVHRAVARGMGPVWEANHVWLIFALVLLLAAFPAAFARLGSGLFLPLHLALAGIILRGAAFVFAARGRQAAGGDAPPRLWAVAFGAGSLAAPFFLGLALAATAQPRLAWHSLFALVVALAVVAAGALEAAAYLAVENRGALRAHFLARARAALAALALLALLALPLARAAAPWLGPRLLGGPGLPFVLLAGGAALLDAHALARGAAELARLWTAALVLLLWAGWAASAWPWLVWGELTAAAAAAPRTALRQLLLLLPWGLLLLLPALALLFALFKGESPAPGPG